MFYFPLKSKMAAKHGNNWNFLQGQDTPVLAYGSIISSKSLYLLPLPRYFEILQYFCTKIQDGHQKLQKLKFFPFA